jgi:hypothetical protein
VDFFANEKYSILHQLSLRRGGGTEVEERQAVMASSSSTHEGGNDDDEVAVGGESVDIAQRRRRRGTVSSRLFRETDLRPPDPPSLVVAIEKDAVAERTAWKGSDYTRGLQVFQVSRPRVLTAVRDNAEPDHGRCAQWTLLARPHHPVFIDALRRIVRTSHAVRSGEMEDPGALDYTGPSMLCVQVGKGELTVLRPR